MQSEQLPLDTWIVVEHCSTKSRALVSQHETQVDAEAERDRLNYEAHWAQYTACKVVEPVAERMGGQRSPVCSS